MNKITKKDKYAIRFLHSEGKTDEYIAKDLDLDLKQVQRFISKNIVEPTQTIPDTPVKVDKTKNLMIRHTSDKKNNTVSIMTQGASQVGDDFYKSLNSSPKNTDSYIHRRS